MFITDLEDFDYRPMVKDGSIVPGMIVTESTLVWYDGEQNHTVLAGFDSDLASLPRFIKPVLSKLGRHQRGAVLHDYFYRNQIGGKYWADKQFNQAMIHDGVSRWKRYIIMSGLFAGGWVGWNKRKRELNK